MRRGAISSALRPALVPSVRRVPFLGLPGGGFSPLSLEPVLCCDLTAATCFQDAAGTIPAGNGDPVGYIADIGADGNHAIQSVNDDFRPTKTANGVAFDAIDDFLLTPQIDLSGTSELTVVMGLLSIGGNANRVMWEFGNAYNGAGVAYLSTEAFFTANVGGGGFVQRRLGADQSPGVITIAFRRDGSAPDIRVNGASVAGTVQFGPSITGPFGSYTMSLGARETGTGAALTAASVQFGGGLIVVPRALTLAETQSCEAWVAERAGITL